MKPTAVQSVEHLIHVHGEAAVVEALAAVFIAVAKRHSGGAPTSYSATVRKIYTKAAGDLAVLATTIRIAT